MGMNTTDANILFSIQIPISANNSLIIPSRLSYRLSYYNLIKKKTKASQPRKRLGGSYLALSLSITFSLTICEAMQASRLTNTTRFP